MSRRLTDDEKEQVIALLRRGVGRNNIAAQLSITPGQVSAILAHVTMGTYNRKSQKKGTVAAIQAETNRIKERSVVAPVLLGVDIQTKEEVFWNIDPNGGVPNPHLLIIGESGFGKTYTTSCILAELARNGVTSIVFDYGQGFSRDSAQSDFFVSGNPTIVDASNDGIAINPLQIFASDLHGPVNVAQRIADTFSRVYPRIGVQQHSILRRAVLDVFADAGIHPERKSTWSSPAPPFRKLHDKLDTYSVDSANARKNLAGAVGSHISTIFVFNTFRESGAKVNWSDFLMFGKIYILSLKGLEYSLERAVTEFLLWNLIGYIESLGPGPLRCFIVLDEAHKLSFASGSPVEKLLREGRKFGLALILASQQPEDFTSISFANTATKLIFQVGDERHSLSRQLHRKVRGHSLDEIAQIITKLPRGWAFTITNNTGRVVRILSFEERLSRWSRM